MTHRIRLARAALALPATLVLAGLTQAQTSPWFAGGMVNLGHESNLLRLAKGQVAPLGASKSDQLTSIALLAGLDERISRQRIFGNLALRDNRYADNRVYNNQGYTATLGVDWATAERLSGNLSGSASRQLSSFNLQEIGLLPEKNLEAVQSMDATLRLGLEGRLALEAGIGAQRVKNSLATAAVQARNYRQDTGSLGLRWRPSAASSLGLALRSTQGRYPQFRLGSDGQYQPDRYERRDIDVSATLEPSSASKLDLRLSSGKTEYDLATQRNYSGLTGTLGWGWQLSGKVALSTRLTRETGQDSYAVTTFFGTPGTTDYSRITDSLRVKADYSVSPKLDFSLAWVWADRDLARTQPSLFSTAQAEGRERTQVLVLGARWKPLRSLSLGCDLSGEQRRGSGDLGSDLGAQAFNCFGQFTLQ